MNFPASFSFLLPIKKIDEVEYGIQYAKNLMRTGLRVKVHILHVVPTSFTQDFFLSFFNDHKNLEYEHAESLVMQAKLKFQDAQIDHTTFILWEGIVPSIFEAAEILSCKKIVISAKPTKPWKQRFGYGITQKLLKSKHNIQVVIVDKNGIEKCPIEPFKKGTSHYLKSIQNGIDSAKNFFIRKAFSSYSSTIFRKIYCNQGYILLCEAKPLHEHFQSRLTVLLYSDQRSVLNLDFPEEKLFPSKHSAIEYARSYGVEWIKKDMANNHLPSH